MKNLTKLSINRIYSKRQEELKQMKCLSMEEIVNSFGVEVKKAGQV